MILLYIKYLERPENILFFKRACFVTRYKQANKAQMKDVRRTSESETGEPFTATNNHRSLPAQVLIALQNESLTSLQLLFFFILFIFFPASVNLDQRMGCFSPASTVIFSAVCCPRLHVFNPWLTHHKMLPLLL